MLRIFVVVLLSGLFSPVFASAARSLNNTDEIFNCEELVGTWSNKTDRHRMIETFFADGRYWIKFIYGNGENVSIQEHDGSWRCVADMMIIVARRGSPAFASEYRILEIKEASYKLRHLGTGIVYEYFKVIN